MLIWQTYFYLLLLSGFFFSGHSKPQLNLSKPILNQDKTIQNISFSLPIDTITLSRHQGGLLWCLIRDSNILSLPAKTVLQNHLRSAVICPYYNVIYTLELLAHTQTQTHTHTHTHVGFYGLRGLSIGVMVFILYKLYVLLPYTYPTLKLSPHRRRCISTFLPKNAHCMIYKHFKLWGHWKCPHKSPSPCNTYVIPMSLYKFVSS